MYKYELHCHTAKTSACASLSAEDAVALYLANGYDGIVVTDHFLNGNTTVHRDLPNGSYEEKIDAYFEGYEEVKAVANGRLKVFSGLEFSYRGTDVLAYGFDREHLKRCPEIPTMPMRDFIEYCKSSGVFAVQAHPFREGSWIDHIRLFPGSEAVEVRNATCDERCNMLGRAYAEAYQKIRTGGSDLHHANQRMLSGMAFDERADSLEELIELIKSGRGEVIYQPNLYQKP